MKRILTLFAVSLVIGIVLMTAGGIMVKKSDVNSGDVYDIMKDNLRIGEPNVTFEPAERIDVFAINNASMDKNITYPLNEFNTLEISADYCSVKLVETESDDMRFSLDIPASLSNKLFLCTAVKNGSLYVVTKRTDEASFGEDVTLTVEIPDNYKGGYVINGSHADISLCDIESSMDIGFNLSGCNVSAGTLSAGDFLIEMSGTNVSAEKISSRGELIFSAVSSAVNLEKLDSPYSKIAVNNTTLNLNRIVGGVTADSQMSTLNFDFQAVTGNVSITSETGSVNITVPHNAPVSLRHDESYSTFSDNVNWTDEGQKNENSRYIIDTNVRFSIVTLSEKE